MKNISFNESLFDILRKKMKKNFNLKGKSSLYRLANHKRAFVFVTLERELHLAELYATDNGFDVIQGNLGKIYQI